ncbi:MAG: class I SAM-dependent methyltransferase [Hyphomicrobiales bacterium]
MSSRAERLSERGTATPRRRPRPDPLRFIRAHMRIAPVPSVPEIRLHTADKTTGLWRLGAPDEHGSEPPAPYWAFPWAGGMALARYILDRPETVTDRRVLDLGTGSGLVAIAAAKAGARQVTACDVDRYAIAAAGLNAAANSVAVTVVDDDPTAGAPPQVELVLAGDLFYERDLAQRVTAFLGRCLALGIDVLIGDPGRAYLPRPRLRLVAEYAVPDIGVANAAAGQSAVFAFE